MAQQSRQDGPPGWFVFLLGVALIFSMYYAWINVREFLRIGGLSIAEATQQAQIQSTGTQERRILIATSLPTRRPTSTPRPECQDFEVIAASGNMRSAPTTSAGLVESYPQGTILCVLGSESGESDFLWYLIDSDPITRRVEAGYMREDIVRPLEPTASPTRTAFPTRTPDERDPTPTPRADEPEPTETPRSSATPRALPTITPMPEPSDTPPGIGV